MKRTLFYILLIITTATIFTSCRKRNNYAFDPQPPAGYQYIFDDNFDYDNYNWSFSDFKNSAFVDISNGALNYTYTPAADGTNTVAISTGARLNYDFLIQSSVSSDNAMGIVIGVSDFNYGYSLMIDDQGYFAIYDEGDAQTPAKAVIDWQYNSAIVAGWNDIEIEQVNGYWIGYANGTKIFDITAPVLRGNKIGFIVLAGTRGRADYLTVKW